MAMFNAFVSKTSPKKKRKLLTPYNVTPPLSRVKQAGKKALGFSHAQFIATVRFEATQQKLLPLVVQKNEHSKGCTLSS